MARAFAPCAALLVLACLIAAVRAQDEQEPAQRPIRKGEELGYEFIEGKLVKLSNEEMTRMRVGEWMGQLASVHRELEAQSPGVASRAKVNAVLEAARQTPSAEAYAALARALRDDDVRTVTLLLASGACNATASEDVARIHWLREGILGYTTVATDLSRFFTTDLGLCVAVAIAALYVFYPFFSPTLDSFGVLWLFDKYSLLAIAVAVVLGYLFLPISSPVLMHATDERTAILALSFTDGRADAVALREVHKCFSLSPRLQLVVSSWVSMAADDREFVRGSLPNLIQELA